MSFVPDNDLGYLDTIQVFFVELTQRSIMFSGRDLKLLEQWRERGATARDVCRGLQDAATAMPSDDPPRNIWSCRKWVEPHVERGRSRGAGGHQQDQVAETGDDTQDSTSGGLVQEALQRIEEAGRQADDEDVRQVYRSAWSRVHDLSKSDDASPYEELANIEEDLVDAYFETLEDQRRTEIEERIEAEAGAHLDRMTEKARREHMVARKRRILIDEEGLAPLLE